MAQGFFVKFVFIFNFLNVNYFPFLDDSSFFDERNILLSPQVQFW